MPRLFHRQLPAALKALDDLNPPIAFTTDFDSQMKRNGLIVTLMLGLCYPAIAGSPPEPRALYTYSFGGLEDMPTTEVVDLLEDTGYHGLAVAARGEESLRRLDSYYKLSQRPGSEFAVVAGYMAHRFDRYGFDDSDHRAAIDRLAPYGGTLWLWVRDVARDGSVTDEKVEQFFRGILDYAVARGVELVLYPHYNTYHPTTWDALPLIEQIDHPSLGVAINLCHELMSDNGPHLARTFAGAKDRLAAVIISGSLVELDRTSVRTMNESTIMPLDESVYDLRPFVQLIKDSGFTGPVGYINYRPGATPADYLKRSLQRWHELCREVGLYEPEPALDP